MPETQNRPNPMLESPNRNPTPSQLLSEAEKLKKSPKANQFQCLKLQSEPIQCLMQLQSENLKKNKQNQRKTKKNNQIQYLPTSGSKRKNTKFL